MLSQLKIKNLKNEIAELESRDPSGEPVKQEVYGVLSEYIENHIEFAEFCAAVMKADMITRIERDFQNNREYYYILLQTKSYYMFIGILKDYVDGNDKREVKLITQKGPKPNEEDLNKMIQGSPCQYNQFKFDYPEINGSCHVLSCDAVYDSTSIYKSETTLPKKLPELEKLIIKHIL